MSEVISLINEKGGVGKSTSSITIAQILAISGYKTLLIDLDPQMNTTKMFGLSEGIEDENYEQLFCSKMDNLEELEYYVTETEYENISILSASRELNNLIYVIYDKMKETNVELYLRHNLALLKEKYDYIIIDNSPFKSYLTTCAMCASDKIITPICVDNFSYDGLMSLIDSVDELNEKYNLNIEFAGIFMTRVAGRTTLFKQMFESYENMFGDKFLPPYIRNSIAVNESNTTFEPLLTYDKRCGAAQDYIELVNYLGLMDNKHYRELAKYLKGEK
ncbi:ParA family protein [Lachnospira sp.]|jgi:chromosome partitioning protein|uniref:ParA family protein n=1 Tax=Lachnospira sp. TaxID=2049031 RepID=UPI00257B6153|nr:ParA family protein [Lachnospira sp.]